MGLTINIIYFCLAVLWISTVKNQYTLYNTDRSRNSPLYHDCLLYPIENFLAYTENLNEFEPPFQIIPYCLRPVNNEIDNNKLVQGNFSSFRFDELNRMNVTMQDLMKWSVPFDVAEDYQEYLDTAKPILAQQILNNCSHTRFGLRCQYKFGLEQDFVRSVTSLFWRKKPLVLNQSFPLEYGRLICYTQLKCDRCLDWREICDGKMDCPTDGVDELNCFDLEMNECAENEYRCQNGLCIPEIFLNDNPFNPDCLDGTDEQEFKDLLYGYSGFPSCYRDPAFRCEESHHPLQLRNFPCGDGETSFIFKSGCANERDVMYYEMLLSFEKNIALSFDCWFILYCATSIYNRRIEQCSIFCKSLNCVYDLQDKCGSDFIFFPQHAMFHDHVRFAYSTNKTIHRRYWQQPLLPDYICYDPQRCSFLTSMLQINGSACKLTTELPITEYFEIDQFFRACPIDYPKNNRTDFHSITLFQCPGTTKFISKHRLLDGTPDCYKGADENNVDTCSLNHKHRFKCQSENKCISRVAVNNVVRDCLGGEDEIHVEKELLSFQDLCNGFKGLVSELIDGQNETDETHCEEWPCDNIYTRCDKAWSCLNGTDESNCAIKSCSHLSFSCVSPYNFTEICLPISRANDGIIDCLGSSDERSYCRKFGKQMFPYRCWNDSTCVSPIDVCEAKVCPFDNIQDQCINNAGFENSLLDMISDVELASRVRRQYFFIIDPESMPQWTNKIRYSASVKPIENTELVLRETSVISDLLSQHDLWHCNRGIPIVIGTEKKYRCFCPPSYYGDRCQFQSQRVSLTLKMRKSCAQNCQGVFGILVTLFDNEQVIHSQEQVTYIPTSNCNRKFDIYLLYNQRSKDLNKTYTIRVDAYNKINISYYATWIFPVQFAFLPVNRISTILTLPATAVSSNCSKFCGHGRCLLYINTGKKFCLCESGWSGEQCTISLNCSCSSDSLCLGVIHNRSTCLCPLHKSGPRCLLPSVCQSSDCQDEDHICIPDDTTGQKVKECLCWQKYFGDECNNALRFEVSFSQLPIPQTLLVHFISAYGDSEPMRLTISARIKLDQDEAIFYMGYTNYNLVFIQIQRQYYLIMVGSRKHTLHVIKIKINPNDRCPHIRELVDKRTSSYPLLRRVKYYHMVCRQRLNLPCFYDEETFMCLCTTERHANCFHFDFNMTYDCHGLNDCENDAECFPDRIDCPDWIACVCQECFYGSKCQFTTKGFGLSLDTILGYSIRPRVPVSRQPTALKVSIAVTTFMFVIGLINGIISTMTFRVKSLQEVGCGYYLLAASIISLLVIIVFTLKFIFLLLSQMSIMTNRTFLYINCISMDFLLRSFLTVNDWLNASVAIERALITIIGTNFNKNKSRQAARLVIFVIILVAFGSTIHDPIYRELVEDKEDERIWCVVRYHSFHLELFNAIINIFHIILPFFINLVSALIIIITASRQRASAQKQISYKQHLREQWHQHNHLIFSSIVLVLLAVPRIIISFLSGCMKSTRNPWLFLTGYFISFVSSLLTFIIYILPSKTYKNIFSTVIKQHWAAFRRRLGIEL